MYSIVHCDNCPTVSNQNQQDTDGDGYGDVCDNCPAVASSDVSDVDGDGLGPACDNCPNAANADQCDLDGDGIGEACESTPTPSALLFDGTFATSNDQVDIPDHDKLHFGQQNFTIELWFKTTKQGEVVLDKRTGGTSTDRGINLRIGTQGEVIFGFYGLYFGQPVDKTLPSAGGFSDGQWHHIAAVRDGAALRLLVDGINASGASGVLGAGVTTTTNLTLGYKADHQDPYRGWLDELRIWSVARSNREIQIDMFTPVPTNAAGLVGGWQFFGSCKDQVIADSGPNHIHGWRGSVKDGPDSAEPEWVVSNVPMVPPPDNDGDGYENPFDNCPALANPGQQDADSDGIGDVCDNCPAAANPGQQDMDADGLGDGCDPDIDGDGWPNAADKCPTRANASQLDTDGDGLGDECDTCPANAPGAVVGTNGCPVPVPGDFDGDGDVDISDYGRFQVCMTGLDSSQLDPTCAGARLDKDTDVDAADLLLFRRCFSGPNVAANPHCLP